MLGEPKNQFSLTRAASKARREKMKFLSINNSRIRGGMFKCLGLRRRASFPNTHSSQLSAGVFISLVLLGLMMILTVGAEAQELRSKWDDGLLRMDLGAVHIKIDPAYEKFSPSVIVAWQHITKVCLLRANIYVNPAALIETRTNHFTFTREKATGKDLLEGFLVAFPAYIYTQDPVTGVIWLHPRSIKYGDIMIEMVEIQRPQLQVPMYSGVLQPLLSLLNPGKKVVIDPTGGGYFQGNVLGLLMKFNLPVDLPAGVYSARDVINFCCLSSPTLAFSAHDTDGKARIGMLVPSRLDYPNPLASERATAVKFWETEVANSTNRPPSSDAIATALSDASPRKRWAAREYCRATDTLSHGIDSEDPIIVVWQRLAWKSIDFIGAGDSAFLKEGEEFVGKRPAILEDLLRKDPGLALVASMELARETKDPDVLDIFLGHRFTAKEVSEVKPDVYRIARESKLIRDKLISMKIGVPELSTAALSELANTNIFRLPISGNN